jgi:hypothetical protein
MGFLQAIRCILRLTYVSVTDVKKYKSKLPDFAV